MSTAMGKYKEIPPDKIILGKFFVGSLCKLRHEFEQTGGSLRRIVNHSCYKCSSINSFDWNLDHERKRAIIRKRYRENNLEKLREQDKLSKRRKRKKNKCQEQT